MQRIDGIVRLQGSGTPVANAQVDVYDVGTLIHATIYSDDGVTLKANPFTADPYGYFFFYAANGRYDTRFSAGTIPTPFTYGDVRTLDIADSLATLDITGALTTGDGATATPSQNFASSPTSGAWWDNALSAWCVSILGNLRLRLANAALTIYGHLYPSGTNAYDFGEPGSRWRNAYINNLYATVLSVYGDVAPGTDNVYTCGTAGKRWLALYLQHVLYFADSVNIKTGTGSPEGAVDAPVGSLWFRTDGGVGTVLYVKESGSGSVGWASK